MLLLSMLAPVAEAAETRIWVGARSGLLYYNETDPDPLENLATVLSIQRANPESQKTINFDDKGWEIPFNLKLGVRVSDSINVWGFYQRMPYVLEAPLPEVTGFVPPNDTVRLDAPANVFGGGVDFRLGSRGYGNSLLMGIGVGTFDVEGDDQDVQGFSNFTLEGSGFFWEVSLMAELEFSTELGFYPFIAFHAATTDRTSATILPRSDAPNEVDVPDFEIDYTAVTIGMSVRFRVYPFDVEGDPTGGEIE